MYLVEDGPTFTPQIDSHSKILAEIAMAKREKAGRKLYDPKPVCEGGRER